MASPDPAALHAVLSALTAAQLRLLEAVAAAPGAGPPGAPGERALTVLLGDAARERVPGELPL